MDVTGVNACFVWDNVPAYWTTFDLSVHGYDHSLSNLTPEIVQCTNLLWLLIVPPPSSILSHMPIIVEQPKRLRPKLRSY